AALGLFMALLGPYGSSEEPAEIRLSYWLLAIVGGGLIGIAVDLTLGARIRAFWLRVLVVALAMTPMVMLLVYTLIAWLLGVPAHLRAAPRLAWQVCAIALLVM